jgi:hypothetical protein
VLMHQASAALTAFGMALEDLRGSNVLG